MCTLLLLFEKRRVVAVTVLSSSSVAADAEGLIDGVAIETTFSGVVVSALSSAGVVVEDAR